MKKIKKVLHDLQASPADMIFIWLVVVFALWTTAVTVVLIYKYLTGEISNASYHSQ